METRFAVMRTLHAPIHPGDDRSRLRVQRSIRVKPHWLPALATGLLLPLAAIATTLHSSTPQPTLRQVRREMASMTVPFEANQGQFAPEVAYAAHTFAGTLFITHDGRIVHALAGKPQSKEAEYLMGGEAIGRPMENRTAISGRFRDVASSSPAPRGHGWALVESMQGAGDLAPTGRVPSDTHVNRFSGGAVANQPSSIPTFERVYLGEPWPGVSVELAARGSNVEKLFTVAPGTNPRTVRIDVAGAKHLRLGRDGSLIAASGNGDIAFTPPVAFQQIGGKRIAVPVRYTLADNGYRFETGRYDRSQPLVIDPLLQSTYLGGSDQDYAYALALDAGGNALVAGYTFSTNFPGTAGGAQPAISNGNYDAFVARLSSNLLSLVQVSYLGGSGVERAVAMGIDASGNVFIAGTTSSTDFPGTAGGAQPGISGNSDVFVARMSSNLQTLVQATYLGGSSYEDGYALAIDGGGSVLVAGSTASTNFPSTSSGGQSVNGGGTDAFVARLSSNLGALAQATYLGGGNSDVANALALDADGKVLVAGNTLSADFPNGGSGAQPKSGGGWDAFIARFSSNLQALEDATYLGGSSGESADALAIGAGGKVFVAGSTLSTNFPATTGGAQAASGGGFSDAYVAQLSTTLATLVRATYLGGNNDDSATALAFDAAGNLLVGGVTSSTNFPGTAGGAQSATGGNWDCFVARLSSNLTASMQTTYIGGGAFDQVNALALDVAGNLLVAGHTESLNFPTTSGGAQAGNAGSSDAFVAKLTANLQGSSDPIFRNGFE